MTVDIKRLKALVREGDTQAALELRERAKRLNDGELSDFLIGQREYHLKRLSQQIELWDFTVEGVGGFAVVLRKIGKKKIYVIKEIRAISGRGLQEAKACTDNCPSIVRNHESKRVARSIQRQLTVAGATVEVVPAHQISGMGPLYDDGFDTPVSLGGDDGLWP